MAQNYKLCGQIAFIIKSGKMLYFPGLIMPGHYIWIFIVRWISGTITNKLCSSSQVLLPLQNTFLQKLCICCIWSITDFVELLLLFWLWNARENETMSLWLLPVINNMICKQRLMFESWPPTVPSGRIVVKSCSIL